MSRHMVALQRFMRAVKKVKTPRELALFLFATASIVGTQLLIEIHDWLSGSPYDVLAFILVALPFLSVVLGSLWLMFLDDMHEKKATTDKEKEKEEAAERRHKELIELLTQVLKRERE